MTDLQDKLEKAQKDKENFDKENVPSKGRFSELEPSSSESNTQGTIDSKKAIMKDRSTERKRERKTERKTAK